MTSLTLNPSFLETIQSSVVCENGQCYGYPIEHAIYNSKPLSEYKGLGRFKDLSIPFWYGRKTYIPQKLHYDINYVPDDELVDVTDSFDEINQGCDVCDHMDDDRFDKVADSIKITAKRKPEMTRKKLKMKMGSNTRKQKK